MKTYRVLKTDHVVICPRLAGSCKERKNNCCGCHLQALQSVIVELAPIIRLPVSHGAYTLVDFFIGMMYENNIGHGHTKVALPSDSNTLYLLTHQSRVTNTVTPTKVTEYYRPHIFHLATTSIDRSGVTVYGCLAAKLSDGTNEAACVRRTQLLHIYHTSLR
jgi:hypothetical protein